MSALVTNSPHWECPHGWSYQKSTHFDYCATCGPDAWKKGWDAFHGNTPDKSATRANSTPPTTPMPHAHALFLEAEHTISGPRRGDYGDAAESFKRIALTWSAVLGVTVTPQQVCLCMVGLKICREANSHKHDSLVDICGYTGLLAEIEALTTKEAQ